MRQVVTFVQVARVNHKVRVGHVGLPQSGWLRDAAIVAQIGADGKRGFAAQPFS
jgi:hypothetical protein